MSETEVQGIAVIGAGTMGPGMASVLASHGYPVRLADIKPEVLERARSTVTAVCQTLEAEGISPSGGAQAASRITFTADPREAADGADFVIEAIVERLEPKQDLFRDLEGVVSESTVLASNTSGIPITRLAEACRRPERVVGMHWSNPPHVIPVIEVIRGERTGDRAVQITRSLIQDIGMIPIEVRRDVAGFVENRILYAIMREAVHLLEEGIASAEDIDTVTKWGIGFKLSVIGPLELLDVAGLDIYHSVAGYLNKDLSNASEVSPLIAEKVERGELGIKSGKGLFDYRDRDAAALMKRRVRALLEVRRALMKALP